MNDDKLFEEEKRLGDIYNPTYVICPICGEVYDYYTHRGIDYCDTCDSECI